MTTPDIAGLCERMRTEEIGPEDLSDIADTLERQAAELVEARTLDKGFSEWMIERDLLARGEEVEWGDIVTALTEHEIELTGDDRLVKRQAAEIERLREALSGINQLARDRLALIPADLVCGGVVGYLLVDILGRAALTGEDS